MTQEQQDNYDHQDQVGGDIEPVWSNKSANLEPLVAKALAKRFNGSTVAEQKN
jgi:hypothetical protein